VIFVLVVGDVVILVTGGAMMVDCFLIGDVPMLLMGEVRSPCCHIGEARKST
jgi:hypothetical protein